MRLKLPEQPKNNRLTPVIPTPVKLLGAPNPRQKPTYVITTPVPKPPPKTEPVKKVNKILENKRAVASKNKETIKPVKPQTPVKDEEDTKADDDSSQNPKLEEIRYIKNELGKKIIAKYRTKNNAKGLLEDNLIVAWDGLEKPQVISYKVKGPGIYALANNIEPHQKKTFRVHDFTKFAPSSKVKNGVKTAKKKKKKKEKVEKAVFQPFKTEYSDD